MSPLDIFHDEAFTSVILKFQNLFTSKKSKKNQEAKESKQCKVECNVNSTATATATVTVMQSKPITTLNIDTSLSSTCSNTNTSISSCSSSPSSSSSNGSPSSKKKRTKPNLTIKTTNMNTKRCSNAMNFQKEHHLTEHLSGDVIQDVFLDWIYTTAYSKFY